MDSKLNTYPVVTKENQKGYKNDPLRKRCQRLGCGCTNNHAFRMAFNSRLLDLGLSAAERALILGHEVQTNEAHYSLVDNRTLEDIKSKLQKEKPCK